MGPTLTRPGRPTPKARELPGTILTSLPLVSIIER
jgi:hypothetical protein